MEKKILYAATRLLVLLGVKRKWRLDKDFFFGEKNYKEECEFLLGHGLVRVKMCKGSPIVIITRKGFRFIGKLTPRRQRDSFTVYVWDDYLEYLRTGKLQANLKKAEEAFEKLLEVESSEFAVQVIKRMKENDLGEQIEANFLTNKNSEE